MSKKLTTEEYKAKYKAFIELYNTGYSQSRIATQLGKSRTSIIKTIKKGIKLNVLVKRDTTTPTKDVKSAKEILKDRDEHNLIQQQVREQSRTELIIDSVKEAIIPIKFYDNITYKSVGNKKEEEEAVLVLSDVHVGKVTKSYNPEIFKERLKKVNTGMLRIIELLRNGYKVDTLNIILGGDIVDGEGIFPTQAMTIDQGVLKQVFQTGVPEFSNMFINLLNYFKKVKVHCVRGNHGRNGRFADETSNWDIALYEACRIATQNYKNIEWNISYDWNNLFKIYDWKFLLVHGHQIKMAMQIPHYGITSKGMRWQGSMGHFDYLILGHFHVAQYCEWNDFEYCMNGTFSSDDEFSQEIIGLMGSCKQLFFGVHPRKGLTWRYKINLFNGDKL